MAEAAPAPSPTPVPPPPPAESAAVPPGLAAPEAAGAVPAYNPAASSKVFNPDIAVIGDFLGAMGHQGPERRAFAGAARGRAELPGHRGSLRPRRLLPDLRARRGGGRGRLHHLPHPARRASSPRSARLRDVFGKVDGQHNHVLPFTDRPLVTKNLTGGEDGMADYGITLSRLIPNRFLFLEATGQVYRGRSNVFDGDEPERPRLRGPPARLPRRQRVVELRPGRLLRLRLQRQRIRTSTRASSAPTPPTAGGRCGARSTTGSWPAPSSCGAAARSQESTRDAFGFYASAEYQFARRWFAGARYDFSDRATDPSLTDKGGSLLLTYWPSEFSQVRGQYRHTRFGEGQTAERVPVPVPLLHRRPRRSRVLTLRPS